MPQLARDIYRSFRALPGWVQAWVGLVLVPVNSASLLFLGQPQGWWIAGLATIPMLLNGVVMIGERGFSRLMALPHLLPWTVLVGLVIAALPSAGGLYCGYLGVLLATDLISLGFDFRDARAWLKGNHAVAGRP